MKKMNKKGFTLIELLAVIVILGLLMAIAIPSVTKYINQSRKKTVVGTIGNYVQALVADVNNADYPDIIDSKIVYAVPIECISIEKGGAKTPWGEWKNGVTGQYAYVLVQPTGNDSYIYGFAFKDSAEYGILPTASNKISENGTEIKSGFTSEFPEVVTEDSGFATYTENNTVKTPTITKVSCPTK